MLLRRSALLLGLLFGASALAASADEQAAMDATQAACEAFRTGKVAELEQLLDAGFTLIGSDGRIQSREDNLAELRRGDPRYEVFRNHQMTARVYGDAAVVQGVTTVKGSANGRAFDVDLRFTDTLIRRAGRWRLVASHATPIARR